MDTHIVDVDEFIVKGYELKGPFSEIPSKWDRLNMKIEEQGIFAEESFDVCVSVKGGEIHYIAGIKANLAEGLLDTAEIVISAGKFIVAKVEGGITAIPTAFAEVHKMDNIRLRNGYGMERYVHPERSVGYAIEVWMPIESTTNTNVWPLHIAL